MAGNRVTVALGRVKAGPKPLRPRPSPGNAGVAAASTDRLSWDGPTLVDRARRDHFAA